MKLPIETIFDSIGKIRILNLLSKYEEMNITSISKMARINHSRVKKYLENLKELDIVQEKRFGRIQIFKINPISEAGNEIKNFFIKWP